MQTLGKQRSLLLLPGDGIGPEVTAAVKPIIEWFQNHGRINCRLEERLMGGASIDAHGVPMTEELRSHIHQVDAVLMGSIGGPKWDHLPWSLRPERALIGIRKEMEVFANLRPIQVFDSLVAASPLKPEIVNGLDLIIVRELTGGVYFGTPRGVETLPDGERRGINTHVYAATEIRRIARVAFQLARARGKKICSVEKSNVMESGVLWREEVSALQASEFTDIELTHMLADNCAMQLVRWPNQFDVIVTDNLFGDILSDLAAMLPGSLGLLPSASLGSPDVSGRVPALYEPIHGSAPDIAGKGIANPIAMILSFAMMLRHTFEQPSDAALLEAAVKGALNSGIRTGDIAERRFKPVTTMAMSDAIIKEMDYLSSKAA